MTESASAKLNESVLIHGFSETVNEKCCQPIVVLNDISNTQILKSCIAMEKLILAPPIISMLTQNQQQYPAREDTTTSNKRLACNQVLNLEGRSTVQIAKNQIEKNGDVITVKKYNVTSHHARVKRGQYDNKRHNKFLHRVSKTVKHKLCNPKVVLRNIINFPFIKSCINSGKLTLSPSVIKMLTQQIPSMKGKSTTLQNQDITVSCSSSFPSIRNEQFTDAYLINKQEDISIQKVQDKRDKDDNHSLLHYRDSPPAKCNIYNPKVALSDISNLQILKSCIDMEKITLSSSVISMLTQQNAATDRKSATITMNNLLIEKHDRNMGISCLTPFSGFPNEHCRDETVFQSDNQSIHHTKEKVRHYANPKRKRSSLSLSSCANSSDERELHKSKVGLHDVINDQGLQSRITTDRLTISPSLTSNIIRKDNSTLEGRSIMNNSLLENKVFDMEETCSVPFPDMGNERHDFMALMSIARDRFDCNLLKSKLNTISSIDIVTRNKQNLTKREMIKWITDTRGNQNTTSSKAVEHTNVTKTINTHSGHQVNSLQWTKSKSNKLTYSKKICKVTYSDASSTNKCKECIDISDNMSSDDELFGLDSHRKRSKSSLLTISPTSEINNLNKFDLLTTESPPCKSLAVLMNYDINFADGSAVKAPVSKQNHPVKRVTKIIKNKRLVSVMRNLFHTTSQ